jgi:predicted unusual protein kinase regulating ubiquinone biosynthesis (AarF/ABC1/UbiB family)
VPTLRPSNAARYATLGRLLLKHRGAVGDTHDPSAGVSGQDDQEDVATATDAEELAGELVAMGPTFVKLGQLLSTRVDLLPPVYLEALSALRDDVRPISADEAIAVVEAELDVKVSKVFRSFNRRPIGAASLGQVHKATLRDGRTVAVKVQRPDVHEQAMADMEVIAELANFVDEHSDRAARVGFGAIAEQFRRSLLDELDYRMEASNLQLLGEQLSDFERIVVPQPVTDLSTSKVLTMDFVAGRSVSSIPDVARAELDLPGLADDLLAAYLDQMLVFGFMHADPHPGNVLLTDDHRVALIDLGMVVRLSPQVQEQMLRLLLAISNRDGEAATEALAHLGTRLDGYDAAALSDRVSDLVLRYTSTTIGELAAGRLLSELALASTTCGLRPRPELSLVARALLSLDEVARTLDPDIQADQVIQSHAARIMRQRMLKAASPTKVMSAALEATALAEALPSRLNKVLESLAEGQLTINLQGLDETAVIRGAQKLANRVATGVLIAAFVIAAALFSGATHVATVWGYPVLTIVFLGLAVVVATWLGLSIVRADLPQGDGRR